MSKPVYSLVLFQGFTEAYYKLSKEEQQNLFAKDEEISKPTGRKVILACNTRWADESTFGWLVIEYPDLEAYQKSVDEGEKLEWWRYVNAKSILGTKMEE